MANENHKKASITSLTRPIGFILANADSIAQLRGSYEEALKHNDNLNLHPNTDLVLRTNASLHEGLNGMKELIKILRGEHKMDSVIANENHKKALLKNAENEPHCQRCGTELAFTSQARHKTVDGKEICSDCKEEQMQEGGAVEGFEGFIPDPSKKEHHYPRKPMKHHVKPKNFLEQVDMDVDQIPAEEAHPDAAEFWPEMGIAERERHADHGEGPNSEIEYKRDMQELDRKRNAMTTKGQLLKLAELLENPENEVLELVSDEALDKVAMVFVKAAEALKEVAEVMAAFEPAPKAITTQKLEEIAAIAEAFDASGDELLQKQASVLDDILITLASPKNALLFTMAEEDDRISELKKKYKETREKQLEGNKISEAIKEIEKAPVYRERKEGRPLQYALSARTCVNHPGAALQRVGENEVRCSLGGEVMNFNEGFTTERGTKIPGTSVQNQQEGETNSFTTFDGDTRAMRMGYNPGE